jgi:hypothetical protein
MQGLANFTSFLGYAISIFLPTFCYLTALGLFLFGGWGLWMQARPENPFLGRPWVPWVSLVLCGAFASFDQVLTMANASAGTNLNVTIAALTSYTPPNAGNVLGTTPGTAIVNVVQLFQGFFQSFGALACFFAVLTWWAIIHGRSNRSQGGCAVQFAFGVMLINILTITQWLVTEFTA